VKTSDVARLLLELAKSSPPPLDHVQWTTRRLAQRFVPGEDLAGRPLTRPALELAGMT